MYLIPIDMDEKFTLVVGASVNPERYSNKAVRSLRMHGHPVLAIGLRAGRTGDVDIQTGMPAFNEVDTITMYLGPSRQPVLYDYILSLRPRRIIFNPGAENPEFEAIAESKGILVEEACTLVLLSTDQY